MFSSILFPDDVHVEAPFSNTRYSCGNIRKPIMTLEPPKEDPISPTLPDISETSGTHLQLPPLRHMSPYRRHSVDPGDFSKRDLLKEKLGPVRRKSDSNRTGSPSQGPSNGDTQVSIEANRRILLENMIITESFCHLLADHQVLPLSMIQDIKVKYVM